MSFEKIPQNRGRLEQLQTGNGNNQYIRSSDFNPVLDYLNSIMGEVTSSTDNSVTGDTVTLNKRSGKITTTSQTVPAGDYNEIVLNNSFISTSSNIIVWIADYTAEFFAAGLPTILKTTTVAGSTTITVGNIHATAALNGILTIKFIIL